MDNYKQIKISDEIEKVPEKHRESALRYLFMRKTRAQRYPYSVTFELTPFCNLNCKMCYVHEQSGGAVKDLSPDVWIGFLDQARDMGAYLLTLTGGEVMMYRGFKEVYLAAYERGFNISIMTNGSMMTDDILEMFLENPPYHICMTLYGMSEETYERACGNKRAFSAAMHTIRTLKENGLPLLLQHTATQDTFDDVPKIAGLAHEMEIPFRVGYNLQSGRNCDTDCLNGIQISPDRALEMHEKIAQARNKVFMEPGLVEIPPDLEIQYKGVSCGAGNNSFTINWKGEMIPCLLFYDFQQDALNIPLKICWEKIKKSVDEVRQIVECQTCKYQKRCLRCIAAHYNDTHEYGKVSDRLCYKKLYGIEE